MGASPNCDFWSPNDVNGIPSAGLVLANPPPAGLANLPNQFSANMLRPLMVPGSGVAVGFFGTPGVTYTVQRAPVLTARGTRSGRPAKCFIALLTSIKNRGHILEAKPSADGGNLVLGGN